MSLWADALTVILSSIGFQLVEKHGSHLFKAIFWSVVAIWNFTFSWLSFRDSDFWFGTIFFFFALVAVWRVIDNWKNRPKKWALGRGLGYKVRAIFARMGVVPANA